MSAVSVKIRKDGSIKLPEEILERHDLHPAEEVVIREEGNKLVIEKLADLYAEFEQILEECFAGATWEEFERDRE